jgi:uncharacterized membrane protein YiaA
VVEHTDTDAHPTPSAVTGRGWWWTFTILTILGAVWALVAAAIGAAAVDGVEFTVLHVVVLILYGVISLGVCIAAIKVTEMWVLPVRDLPLGARLLAYGAVIPSAAVLGLIVLVVWAVCKLIGLFFGSGESNRSSRSFFGAVFDSMRASATPKRTGDWDRIINAKYIGDERVVHDGQFTYIGGRPVTYDAGVPYVGTDRVIVDEGGRLWIGSKAAIREGDSLFVDGKRVHE